MIRRTLMVIVLLAGMGTVAAQEQGADPEDLVRQLGDARFRVRETAQRKLVALGKASVPALRRALRSHDLEVRARARKILNIIQSRVEYLLDELNSGNGPARRAAAESLGQLGKEARDAIPALVRLLRDRDEDVQEAAAGALAAIDPDNKALADHLPPAAHVSGKYAKLLRKIKVEGDLGGYGKFNDYGHHPACNWGGYTNLPGGYWVYVYPHWYIWGEQKGVAAPPGVGQPAVRVLTK